MVVTDADTIALSNLSRQFLFREHNVGQLKSRAACDMLEHFMHLPYCTCTSHTASTSASDTSSSLDTSLDAALPRGDVRTRGRRGGARVVPKEVFVDAQSETVFHGTFASHMPSVYTLHSLPYLVCPSLHCFVLQ